MRDKAVKWAVTAVSAPSDEPVTEPDELPDDLNDLLALANALDELAKAAATVKREVEAKAAQTLGPGKWHEYGAQKVRWGHSYSWKAEPEAVERMIAHAARVDPTLILDLFNPNSIRKTGVERVAAKLDMDPEAAVKTLLYKKWSSEPGLQWKPVDQ